MRAEVAKRHSVNEVTIYTWRKRFGKLESADVKRLRQLEQENNRLKKLLAERDLDIEIMKEVNAKKCVSARVRRFKSPTWRNVGDLSGERVRCYQLLDRL